jgi:hypothetical protein
MDTRRWWFTFVEQKFKEFFSPFQPFVRFFSGGKNFESVFAVSGETMKGNLLQDMIKFDKPEGFI